MFNKHFSALILLTALITGCGGSSGTTDNNGGNTENSDSAQTPEPVTRNLTLAMKTESAIDRDSGEVILVTIRSIANDDSVLQEKSAIATPAAGSNVSTDWQLSSDVILDQQGGKVVLNASAPGFISYGSSYAYKNPVDVELRGELLETTTVSVDIPALRTRARGSNAAQDQYVSLRLTRDLTTGEPRVLAGKSVEIPENQVDDLAIDIPLDEIPAGVTQLNARMRGFDSSSVDDNQYFPGEYADSDGNKLLSIAFNYVEISDQNGRNLGEAMRSERLSAIANNQAARANVTPTIITRLIPRGSCPSVNSLGDANANLAGLQIPVYTYNPDSGLWDLLGYGTVTDINNISPAAGSLDCSNVDYSLSIEVDNEDFLRSWWNLDYPLVFSQPIEVCTRVKLVDKKGAPVSGVWVSLFDDDGRSFSTQYGFTDEAGEVTLTTVLLDSNDIDRSASLRFWSYNDNSYRTETVQLSENCSTSAAQVIELQHLDLCSVEGRVVMDTDTSTGMSGAIIYAYAASDGNFDIKYVTSNEQGYFKSSVLCEADYVLYSWPTFSSEIQFNVDGLLSSSEATDDGQKVVLQQLIKENMAPTGFLYLTGNGAIASDFAVDSLNATLTAGEHELKFWGFDYDGHFPVSYSVSILSSTNQTILTQSGTFDDWGAEEIVQNVMIPESGDYTITYQITDGLAKQGSTNLYSLEYSPATE